MAAKVSPASISRKVPPVRYVSTAGGNMKRREFITLLSSVAVSWPTAIHASTQPIPSVGWLKVQGPQHSPSQLRAFRQGMTAGGLIEGRDYTIIERYANGDEAQLPSLAAELIKAGVGVIVATSQPSIAAAARITTVVPILGRMVDDPVANGMAQSLARPGRNITGIYTLTEEMNPKRLALLKEIAPSVRRVGVLLRPDTANAEHTWQAALAAARQLDLELLAFEANSSDEITAALEPASAIDGIITFRNPTLVTHLKLITELCRRHRLPAVFDAREYVEAGGLVSYGPNIDATYRGLATYVDKLLHGASISQLPVVQPTAFELIINKTTADAMSLALPSSLLARADEVIE